MMDLFLTRDSDTPRVGNGNEKVLEASKEPGGRGRNYVLCKGK